MRDIEHFLISEINMCQRRWKEPSNFYDGVRVGFRKSYKLNNNHIAFCRHLLKLIEKEQR